MKQKKMFTLVMCLFLGLLITEKVNSQNIENLLNDHLYKTRVKLVDEFRERFNLESFREELDAGTEDYFEKNILLLCNLETMKSEQDTAFIQAMEFAKTIVRNHIKINYPDTTWVAKAHCHGKLKGKDIDFVLYLNVQSRGNDMYKWVIGRAEGKKLMLSPSKRHDRIMLMPDDHETKFTSLRNITANQPDDVLNFAQRGVSIDPTSVFFAFVYTGDLTIEYVKPLEFIFLQVPGYKFNLKYYERESTNAGWLIDSIIPCSDKEKENFLNYLYFHDTI